ncbi:MAG: S-layer homology domain-containing protein [Candidatus Margulisiibacteriota bacterium]
MTKKVCFVFIFVFFCLLQSASLAAFSELSKTFLRVDYSARSLGMGGANTAVVDDPNAVFFNPAAIPYADGFCLNTNQTFSKSSAAFVYPLSDNSGLGFGFANKNLSNIILDSGVTASTTAQMFVLSYGIAPNDRLSLGMTFKYLPRQTYEQGTTYQTISGFDGDLGVMWQTNDWIKLGGLVSNVLQAELPQWPTGNQKDQRSFRAGISAQVIGDVLSPIYMENKKLILVSDIELQPNRTIVEVGGEYSLAGKYFVRAGLNNLGVNFGLGLKLGKVSFDIASACDTFTSERLLYVSCGYSPSEWSFQKRNMPGWASEGLFIDEISLQDNCVTYDEVLAVKGKTKPGVSMKANSNAVYVAPDGTFTYQLPLRLGKNLIIFEAGYSGEKKSYQYRVLRKAKIQIAEEISLNAKLVSAEGITKQNLEKQKEAVLQKKQKLEVLVTMGIVDVKPNTDFKMDSAITRAEMASWIVKAAKLPISSVNAAVFKDVPPNNPFAYYIKTVTDNRIMSGYPDGTFRPNQPVTEEEGKEIFKKFGVIK